MLFHDSSSDSDNSEDTAEVVSPTAVSTIDRVVASVVPLSSDLGKMGRACSTWGKAFLVGKPRGTRPFRVWAVLTTQGYYKAAVDECSSRRKVVQPELTKISRPVSERSM
jgi:hypothetical protein